MSGKTWRLLRYNFFLSSNFFFSSRSFFFNLRSIRTHEPPTLDKKKHHHHWSSFPWIWIEFRSKLIKFRSFSCYHHISLANFIQAIFSHYWMRWSGNQVSWKVNKMQWEKNISVMKMWEWGKENVYQVDFLVYSNDLWLHRISHTVCIRTEQMTSCENIAAVNVLREREMYNHNL